MSVVPVVGQEPLKLINLAMTGLAGFGLLMIGLAVVLRSVDAFYRGAGAIGGILMVAFAASFLISPLAGLILLTLTTFGVFATLAVTYLFGPVDEIAEETAVAEETEAAEDTDAVKEERRSAEVIRHPAWHTPIPANLPRAVELKQEVCKPHARLML